MSIKKLRKEDALPGSLSKYAKNVKGKIPFKKIREMAWEKAVCEKERKRKKIKIPLSIFSKKSTKDSLENIIGIGKSGIKDGSIKHDHYLYDKK